MAEIRRKTTARKNDTSQLIEHGKLQPQAVDLEEEVLGALMLEKNANTIFYYNLKHDIFYKESHQ
ncbi:MAG: hypothetical protein ACK5XN_16570 [Bacteroidota bacterium]